MENDVSAENSIVLEASDSETVCSNLNENVSEVPKNLTEDNKELNNDINTTNDTGYTYTDPVSKTEYVWNQEEYMWKPKQSGDTEINYNFDGSTYKYIDKNSNKTYIWDTDINSWTEDSGNESKADDNLVNKAKKENEEDKIMYQNSDNAHLNQDMSKGCYGYDGDIATYTDSTDGTVYFWDKEKKAWFPKIDDTFMAYYQLNYGFSSNCAESSDTNTKPDAVKKEESKEAENVTQSTKRKAPQPASWFELDEKRNTKVYVNNLPLDITEEEFVDLMQKCGLVMKDIDTGKMKVKLYMEPDGKHLKGDALCTYIKRESVDLALQLLDGYDYKGRKLKVEKAQFTMKGKEYNPSLKPKTKRRKDKEKIKKAQEKLFDWRPDKLRGERSKHECVVVIKNLFEPKIFDDNLGLILEYRQDVREECCKCGAVRKVVLYDKHADGIAQVWFKEAEAADACVQLLNNRWFGKRLISAETWDGKTKYRIDETKEETQARLKKWEEYLSSNKANENDKEQVSTQVKSVESVDTAAADGDSDETRSSAGSCDETDEEETVIKTKPVNDNNDEISV